MKAINAQRNISFTINYGIVDVHESGQFFVWQPIILSLEPPIYLAYF